MNKIETNGSSLIGKTNVSAVEVTNGKSNGSCNGNGAAPTTVHDAKVVDMYVLFCDLCLMTPTIKSALNTSFKWIDFPKLNEM